MPILTSLRKLACCSAPQEVEEEAEEPARPPRPEPEQARFIRPGRPYREYVEGEAERFRREPDTGGDPGQPQQELSPAQVIALKAVNATQRHLIETGVLKPPYSRLHVFPNHVEALIQLADDAGWLAKEIPLPAHPEPRHPPIYYTIEPPGNRPVPRKDALIRGDYIYTSSGHRFIDDDHVVPWRGPAPEPSVTDLTSRNLKRCYSLNRTGETFQIRIHWINDTNPFRLRMMSVRLDKLQFLPKPPRHKP